MKALKKKYGKRPWLDTPNSKWYRDRVILVRFLRCASIAGIGAAGTARVLAILSTTIPGAQKSILIAENTVNTMEAMAATINSEQHRMPYKNKGSHAIQTKPRTEK